MTSKGIAKGMWQFIPETAVKYGLHIGPLVDLRRPDPGDDRHHYDRETKAAAAYLKDLYSSDAQASAFTRNGLVTTGVRDAYLPLVRSMPNNPKERKLLATPDQISATKFLRKRMITSFNIVSAAVIGEDPPPFRL